MAKAKVVDELDQFRDWIVARGAELLVTTNEYELLRFRGADGVGIVYENKKNHRTFVGPANPAWHAFKKGEGTFRFAERATRKRPIVIRTLIHRDGERCFYCGDPFSEELPPTREHLVPRTAGGPDHVSNMFLSCGPCNCEVGHRSAADKIKFRDLKRRGAGTMLLTDIRQLIVKLNIIEHVPLFAPILRRIDQIIHTPKGNEDGK